MEEPPGRLIYSPSKSEPASAPQASSSKPEKKSRGLRWLWLWLLGLIVVLGLATGVLAYTGTGPFNTTTTVWSAVHLNDGEIFFGHIKSVTADTVELTNVYYVQKPAASAANQSISVVSFVSTQIQCPVDDVKITRSLVLYFEDMQSNSYVVQQLNRLNQTPKSCFEPSSAASSPTAAATPTPNPSPTPR